MNIRLLLDLIKDLPENERDEEYASLLLSIPDLHKKSPFTKEEAEYICNNVLCDPLELTKIPTKITKQFFNNVFMGLGFETETTNDKIIFK